MPKLSITDHSRDSAGLVYVYPVISRRSGGLSIGINLNPNNACNWHCAYCQVPNLIRGAAPDIDLARLREELRGLLKDALYGDFYRRHGLPEEQWAIRDIAISGNGEPTGSRAFGAVVRLVGETVDDLGLAGNIKRVLITNGSRIHAPLVQTGLKHWADLGGKTWFKLDSATAEGMLRINGVRLDPAGVARNLETCARLCPTWIQTCVFAHDGTPPSPAEQQAYLDFLAERLNRQTPIQGVMVYGLARPSMQPEAGRLSALPVFWLEEMGKRIRALGLPVRVN